MMSRQNNTARAVSLTKYVWMSIPVITGFAAGDTLMLAPSRRFFQDHVKFTTRCVRGEAEARHRRGSRSSLQGADVCARQCRRPLFAAREVLTSHAAQHSAAPVRAVQQ